MLLPNWGVSRAGEMRLTILCNGQLKGDGRNGLDGLQPESSCAALTAAAGRVRRSFFTKATKGRLLVGAVCGGGVVFASRIGMWLSRGGACCASFAPGYRLYPLRGSEGEEGGFTRRGGRLRSAAQRTERTPLLAHARRPLNVSPLRGSARGGILGHAVRGLAPTATIVSALRA